MSKSILKEFYFNTGVKYGVNPYADNNYRAVESKDGGLVMVIPFYCENIPDDFIFKFACDDPELKINDKNFIVREIQNSKLLSKYAYFSKKQ